MDIGEKLEKLVEKDERYRELKAEMEALDVELGELKGEIFTEMEKMGVSSLKVKGRTVYQFRQVWAGAVDRNNRAVVEALEGLGLSHMISFNHQQLSAYVREQAREHGFCDADDKITGTVEEILSSLPEQLQPVVSITPKTDLRIRKK